MATWRWVANDENCGICRMAFDGCCPDCKLPGDDCPLGKICHMAFDGCCPDCKLPGDDCPLGKILSRPLLDP